MSTVTESRINRSRERGRDEGPTLLNTPTARARSRSNTRPSPIKLPEAPFKKLGGNAARSTETKIDETENEEDGLDPGDAQSMVGVSIGREQTRLMSPTTPAAERSAALDSMNSWGFFDGVEDEEQEEILRNTLHNAFSPMKPHTDQDASPSTAQGRWETPRLALPSPWTAGPKQFIQVDESKFKGRRSPREGSRNGSRAGTTNVLGDLSKRLLSTLSFPITKDSSKPSPNSAEKETLQAPNRPGRSNSLFTNRLPWNGSPSLRSKSRDVSPNPGSRNLREGTSHRRIQSSSLEDTPSSTKSDAYQNGELAMHPTEHLDGRNEKKLQEWIPRLRRSNSHDSIPLSAVSSLGDDERWANIDAQVNTRIKAIKDSLQDSLPSMPNINFSALRPDFQFRRSAESSTATLGSINGKLSNRSRAASESSTVPPSPQKLATSRFPILDEALNELTGDLVVMGGYRGSILRSAEPPHRQLWVPIKVGLNIRKVDLEVGLNPEDEESMEDRIFASGMLTNIGPVDISRRLFKRMRNCKNAREGKLRVHDYGYDWRLSPELLSRKLVDFLKGLECNHHGNPDVRGATVIAHSLGGLITRHAVNQRPELFAGVVYAGVPQHCVNILGPFRNGDEVLLSSKVLTAQVNFTLRTSFALLPESGQCFIDKDTKEQYHVDFFNVESWKQYAFSPCIASCLPALSQPERRGILGSISSTFPSFSTSTVADPSNSFSQPIVPNQTTSTTSSPQSKESSSSASSPSNLLATKADDILNPDSHTLNMQMAPPSHPSTTSTIPLPQALSYLSRTLTATLRFKRALAHNPAHESANAYPPHAIIYSTSIPTVYGARVAGREGIKRADAYDNLAFASGDGVVLARAAMVPRGYRVVEGGRVRTERGHVGLLGDLEAVGRCLSAVVRARKRAGIGLGRDFGEVVREDDGLGLTFGGEERGRQMNGGDGRGDGRPF